MPPSGVQREAPEISKCAESQSRRYTSKTERLRVMCHGSIAEAQGQMPIGWKFSSGSEASLPAEERLKARVEAFHEAQGARDSRAMYLMSPPYIRSEISFEEFKREWGLDEKWALEPHTNISTKIESICSCVSGVFAFPTRPRTVRCVLLLDFTTLEPGANPKQSKNLEMWEYLSGEWYFGYPGEGEDHCPVDGR